MIQKRQHRCTFQAKENAAMNHKIIGNDCLSKPKPWNIKLPTKIYEYIDINSTTPRRKEHDKFIKKINQNRIIKLGNHVISFT